MSHEVVIDLGLRAPARAVAEPRLELLDRLKLRDGQAQLELRQEAFPKVLGTCRHVLKDPVRAEEAAEDIFIDFLYDQVDRVRKSESLWPYLRMMTVRRCIRLRQLERRAKSVDGDDLMPAPTVDAEEPVLCRIDVERDLERLRGCLGRLSNRQKEILRLRFHHELSFSAIGHRLGTSKQYAGRTAKEALGSLRKCVGKR